MLEQSLRLKSGVTLRNRTALAPLTNTMSGPDGHASAEDLRFLSLRAQGGFGLVSTCAAYVSPQGKAWVGQLGIADDSHVAGLRTLADAIEGAGARSIVQLHHAGAKADEAPVRLSTVDGDGVKGATEDELDQVVTDFVAAALRAQAAGFSGVEVHGANGYLFTQFLAPADNTRDDAYGGALEGRARLLREVVQSIRAAVPSDFAVGVRLSPVDFWARRGLLLADSVQVAKWLVEDGVEFVHLSGGEACGTPRHEPEAGIIATAFRNALPDHIPVFAVGSIWTQADAQKASDAGADVVVLGRAAMSHPDRPVA
ncbi:MAG: NADH:flavin oxidoreductase, partial [Proteobacteria bacterium]|nr:NADH:flavin oxidoreductase [Pseudomonadota bacterium]